MLAQHFSKVFGQQFFVENKPGAGNMIGIEAAARSAPDGYTLLMVASTLVLNSVLYKQVAYDPVRETWRPRRLTQGGAELREIMRAPSSGRGRARRA